MTQLQRKKTPDEHEAVSSVRARLKQSSLIATGSCEESLGSDIPSVPKGSDTPQIEHVQQNYTPRSTRVPPERQGGMKKLLIAAGADQTRHDWWNVSLRPALGTDEVIDLSQPWRWKDLLDLIYAERCIESLPVDVALRFLANAGSALRVGGRIRLSTPSLEWVLKSHFTFDPQDLAHRLGDTLTINRAFYGWGHRFLYSKEMLYELMKQVGFQDITFAKHGQSAFKDLRGMERHPSGSSYEGFDNAWIVEASRGDERPAVGVWADAWLRESFTQYVRLQDAHIEFEPGLK